MKKITSLGVLILCLAIGCAALTPAVIGGVGLAVNSITTARDLLSTLDKFYNSLVEKKTMPALREQATKALAIADSAAVTLRSAAAGGVVTDTQLNVAAGQVAGAQAILKEMAK